MTETMCAIQSFLIVHHVASWEHVNFLICLISNTSPHNLQHISRILKIATHHTEYQYILGKTETCRQPGDLSPLVLPFWFRSVSSASQIHFGGLFDSPWSHTIRTHAFHDSLMDRRFCNVFSFQKQRNALPTFGNAFRHHHDGNYAFSPHKQRDTLAS